MFPQKRFSEEELGRVVLEIRQRCQIARAARLMSQDDLAKHLGLSRPTVSWVEDGKQRVTIGYIVQLAAVTGAPVAWLMGEGERKDWEPSGIVRFDPRYIDRTL